MEIKKIQYFVEKRVDSLEKEEKTYERLTKGVNDLVRKNLSKSDFKTKKDLATAYLRDEGKNPIEGFINDSDIYEFYLKYRDDVDDLLLDLRWFDEVPTDNNIYSIYDYIILSTKKAFRETLSKID